MLILSHLVPKSDVVTWYSGKVVHMRATDFVKGVSMVTCLHACRPDPVASTTVMMR